MLNESARRLIYPDLLIEELAALVEFTGEPATGEQVEADPSLLAGVEVLISGWGAPRLDERVLASAELKAVFYGAGSVRGFMTQAAWDAGLVVTSAAAANAVSVAEFTVAQVFMCLKRVWQHDRALQATRQWQAGEPGAGGYGSRVGLISLGQIGRLVARKLADSDVELLAYDTRQDAEAQRLGVRYATLEEIFATCDVVSLHTPLLPETKGMVGESLLRSMRPGASLINTARGAVIDQAALERVLADRPDLFAVLDVVYPEPLPPQSSLWDLGNVVLVPHIAGARGAECERMGRMMLGELRRYVTGRPLHYQLVAETARMTA